MARLSKATDSAQSCGSGRPSVLPPEMSARLSPTPETRCQSSTSPFYAHISRFAVMTPLRSQPRSRGFDGPAGGVQSRASNGFPKLSSKRSSSRASICGTCREPSVGASLMTGRLMPAGILSVWVLQSRSVCKRNSLEPYGKQGRARLTLGPGAATIDRSITAPGGDFVPRLFSNCCSYVTFSRLTPKNIVKRQS